MSADSDAAGWDLPPSSGEFTEDEERLRLHWSPSGGVRKKAVFDIERGEFAVLQYVWTCHLRQKGTTSSRINDNAVLQDVPEGLRAIVRTRGFEPVNALFGEEGVNA